jgi:hypothetical protein
LSTEPVKDPLALGLGSLASGVGFGGACMTVSQIVVGLNENNYNANGYVLAGGVLTALGVGGMCGWFRSYHLENVWQQGVIAVLGAIGAILIGFLAAPIDKFFGVVGMSVWLACTITLGVLATRWASRGRGDLGSGTGTT